MRDFRDGLKIHDVISSCFNSLLLSSHLRFHFCKLSCPKHFRCGKKISYTLTHGLENTHHYWLIWPPSAGLWKTTCPLCFGLSVSLGATLTWLAFGALKKNFDLIYVFNNLGMNSCASVCLDVLQGIIWLAESLFSSKNLEAASVQNVIQGLRGDQTEVVLLYAAGYIWLTKS